ncbi:MAG TPA: TonB-dependent receptor [Bryobacteraceae bacterium]|nr:TonB-dependent receptor [Bryobacteraceae bacterium]
MTPQRSRAWTLVPVLLAGALALRAAERAEVAGLVQDVSGAVLAGAGVTIMDESTGIRRSARTDDEGVYDIAGLPPGSYKVTVRKPGFQTVVRLSVQVDFGADLRLDFALRLGSMRELITVEGGAPAVNTADASVGTLVGRTAIQSLPANGRGVLALVELAPGVVATPATGGEAGQFSANGLRSNTNYFTVDGVSANTGVSGAGLPAQFAGAALPAMTAFGSTQNLASMESLDEVRVQTSSFAPEFGRLPGAQVALTTRAGSDELHGSAYGMFRPHAAAANDWFAGSYGVSPPPPRVAQWGATLGGPLLPQRTYFFASYEALRLRDPHSWLLATPSQAVRLSAPALDQPILNAFPVPLGGASGVGLAEASRPSRLDTLSFRIDHSFGDRVLLFARYSRPPSSTQAGFAEVESFRLGADNFTTGITAMPAPHVTNDVRVSVWRTTADSSWSSDPAAGGSPVDLAGFLHAPQSPGPAFYGVDIGGVGALFSGISGRNHQGEWNLVETLAVNRGSHSWRLGADYQRLTPARDSPALAVTGAWNNLAALLAGRPPMIATTQADQASSLIETLSLFAQDTYRPSRRLSLTYGLRWEVTPPPAVREPAAAYAQAPLPVFAAPAAPPDFPLTDTTRPLWTSSYRQLAPRIGAAFRLDDHSVLRAGLGIFYDVGFGVALDPINGFPFNRWQFSNTGLAPPVAGVPAFGPRVAAGLQLPYVAEWNLSYERAFDTRNIVSVSYVGSSGQRLLRREGTLLPSSTLAQYEAATNHGASDYEGLELQYRRRMSGLLQGTASYAWSHSIDNGSSDSGVYLADPRLPLGSDRGSSDFDIRHNVTTAFIFTPQLHGWLARDWELSAMMRARSGFPIDVVTTKNLLGLGFDNVSRPNRVPGLPLWIPDHSLGGLRLNPAAFAVAPGLQGSLGRNAIPGFGMAQLDLALGRTVPVSRSTNLQVRLEAFNLFNHPNPADPVRFRDSPLFGVPASMLDLMLGTGTARSGVAPAFQTGGPRSLQATLRLQF